ncbi:MAG: RdgB/HAM1 family non-canonical purine NTP pyrophosphatase [Bdellovibrionota bacterium]
MLSSLNRGKIHEYQALFQEYPDLQFKTLEELVFNVSSLKEAETGTTYYQNAFNKGKLGHLASKYPTISDDSGLEVDALEGRPGVFSDRYATLKPGDTQDLANNRKLLDELKNVPKEKRTARFTCTLVFFVEGVVLSSTGAMEGQILEAPRGSRGFGYDPLFLVTGSDKTLAELSLEEKNKISHRAKAFHALMAQIKEKGIKLVRP